MNGKHLGKDIMKAASKQGINPFVKPFTPGELRLDASAYGSFADWCNPNAAKSGKWNKHICLKVAERTPNGRPRRYILLPQQQWQDC